MGLEAHACSLRVFVTLHVSGAVPWVLDMVTYSKHPRDLLIGHCDP